MQQHEDGLPGHTHPTVLSGIYTIIAGGLLLVAVVCEVACGKAHPATLFLLAASAAFWVVSGVASCAGY
jgi:hypothetical protein